MKDAHGQEAGRIGWGEMEGEREERTAKRKESHGTEAKRKN